MFNLCRNARFISKKFKVLPPLKLCNYFSAEKDFVRKVRTLERLKGSETFSQSHYEVGKYIIFLKSEMVFVENNERLVYKNYKDVQEIKKFGQSITIFLELLEESHKEICLFAVDLTLESEGEVEQIEVDYEGKFVNVKRSLYFLNKKESQFVIHARGLLNFCNSFKFCCYCGGRLETKEGGYQKQCISCKFVHYPNLSPIGITLVEDENHEEVLLIRQQRHPPGTYTCVAGFIEPGESLEDNVKREVAEEVGLTVHVVQYCTSQHWALPANQFTLGCIATVTDKNPEIDVKEIVDAKWVNAHDLRDAVLRVRSIKNLNEMNDKKLWAPPSNAVSHHLMVSWLKKYHKFEDASSS